MMETNVINRLILTIFFYTDFIFRLLFHLLITEVLRIKISDGSFEWRFDDSLIIFKFV